MSLTVLHFQERIDPTDGCALKEELPPNMPEPRGQGFTIHVYIDADHAGDTITHRSRSDFVVFLNSTPVYWSNTKQTSCETFTYGSEIVAMRAAGEYVKGLFDTSSE